MDRVCPAPYPLLVSSQENVPPNLSFCSKEPIILFL
jgi:hypothetical protein